jgi:hypothetical protein
MSPEAPMSRYLFPFAVVSFLAGCVPVTVPLSDPAKAEPDKDLIGKWMAQAVGKYKVPADGKPKTLEIDVPVVKGNPKGLMRAEGEALSSKPCWFFTTKIDKHDYATIFMGPDRSARGGAFSIGPKTPENADFKDEGEFEKFIKSEEQSYYIISYTIKGNDLIVDYGSNHKFNIIMSDEKIESMKISDNHNFDFKTDYYKTPKDWLANYLKKEPRKIYDGTSTLTYRRIKN